jgi:LuxR family maltose regulon positive regulatory protein
VLCTTGDYELAAALAEQCNTDAPHPPWVANALRVVAAAACLHTGRWAQLHVAPTVRRETNDPTGGDLTALGYQQSIRGLAELRQGHLDEAAALLEEGLSANSPPLAALPAPTLALVRYLQDRTGEAARINAEHMEVNKRVAPIEGLYAAYLVAARLARLDGQPVLARHLLDEGESIGAARGWRRVQVTLLLEKVRLCLLDGRLAEAGASDRCLEALAAGAKSRLDRTDFGRAARLSRAWCDLVDARPARAVETLNLLLDSSRQDGRLVDCIGVLGSLALAQLAGGELPAACQALREACRLVHSTGALRALLDQPVPLAPLLQSMLRSRAELSAHPWLEPVLARAHRARGEPGPLGPTPTSLDSLSPREHHVLRLLAKGRSNKEIARGLGIAPETVKTHVSKIFSKLGAQNRAQAAAMVVT